ncbi:MAG: Gfo/Idh/MocA family oxidoreductase [Acidobacteriota bacterium]|nr:MAG: Gfo/Idh/MocA family oxidoreductase [Acidobacteriota bacterium]
MGDEKPDDYGLSRNEAKSRFGAPELEYLPPKPASYSPEIGIIGCGGIAGQQLAAYRQAGYRVTALCDRTEAKAAALRDRIYPEARIAADYRDILADDRIEVVDITTHPADRVKLIEAALEAGKHVLSQKPFVTDLDTGDRLADLADRRERLLAVNQNGRWAPHFSYIHQAIAGGLIGEVQTVDFWLHWDHTWIIGTPFEKVRHLILYDFAIHWFDLANLFFGGRKAKSVYAAAARSVSQRARPPMLAQALIEFDGGQASLILNANVEHGQDDRTFVSGSKGSIVSRGPSLSDQSVTIHTSEGFAQPRLEGTWFVNGFQGAMGELLCAIDEERQPGNNARQNLESLAICFAAIASADQGRAIVPGDIRYISN